MTEPDRRRHRLRTEKDEWAYVWEVRFERKTP